MELIIYNQPTAELIKFNNEELIKELTEKLGHYNNLTYTDAEIKIAKSDRATLNKFKEAIEKRRKEIKSNCMKPYEDFEIKVKQIVKMIDQPILAIDTQVKAYAEKVKAEKRAEIIAFYNEIIEELVDLVPLEKIWVEKWLNASESMKAIKSDIKLVIDKVRSDIEVISSLQSEFELQIRETYFKTLQLNTALQEKARLEDQKAKQEAYNKAQAEKREQARLEAERQETAKTERVEALRLARETEIKQAESTPTPESDLMPEPEPVVEIVETQEEVSEEITPEIQSEVIPEQEVRQIDFRVWVTPIQLEALKEFLQDFEIKYGSVN